MKNFKMLGLATAVFAASLMAFANAASATIFTSPEGTTYTGSIVGTSTNMELSGAFVTVKCGHAEFKAKVEEHGAGTDAGGKNSSLTFTECNYTTTVKNAGSMDVDGSNNLDWFNTQIEVATSVGTCVFTADPVWQFGSYMGYVIEGSNASIHFNFGELDRTGGNFLCGSVGYLKGSWDLTTPNNLWVD